MRKIWLVVLLTACRHHHAWRKGAWTPQEFKRDAYACKHDASFTSVGRFGTGVDMDENLFDECMGARGWWDANAKE